MTRRILSVGLVVGLGWVGPGACGATASVDDSSGVLKGARIPAGLVREIKITGEGQLDLEGLSVTFAGQASHLGRFTATGEYAPNPQQVRGMITVNQGDFLYYVFSFAGVGDLHGEQPCSINMGPGSGRFSYTRATASGTATVNDDDSFTFDLDGFIWNVEPPPPCLAEPCLDSF